MSNKEKEELFAFLVHLNTKLNEVEALHKEKNVSLSTQIESLTFLNHWAEGRVKTLEQNLDDLRRENQQLQLKLQKTESDKKVASKELELVQDRNRFLEMERDTLDARNKESDNQRKRMRSSYSELARAFDTDLKPMQDLKRLLMN